MFSDLKFALRQLIKSPGFTVVALLTLALGIGVNSSMYTLVDTLLFRSAPFPEPDRMLVIQGLTAQGQPDGFSYAEIDEMRALAAASPSSAFESITAFSQWNNDMAEPGQPAERLVSLDASIDFFGTFRVQPMLGRPYSAEEEVPGRTQVAILSHKLWQSRFGGDPTIVGRTLRLNAEQVTVIGVMPPGFGYPLFFGPIDLWRPMTVPRHIVEDRNNHFFGAVGRLRPGVTAAQATAQLKPLLARWAHDYPQVSAGRGVKVMLLQKAILTGSPFAFITWLLFGVGAAVLLIACFNLANLQLARAAANTRDLAIRSALGASRGRLIVHQLTESMVLALSGGALGLLVGMWSNDLIGRSIPIGATETLHLDMNGPVLGAAFLVSLLSGLLVGLVPAWLASRGDMVTTLKQQTRGSTSSRGTHRLRNSLVVAEVALALALLATAGVMIRGFSALLKRDKGWDTDRVLLANIHLPEQSRYSTEDSRRVVIDKLTRRLAQIPHAERTAICSSPPLFGYSKNVSFEVPGVTPDDPTKQPIGGYIMVTTDFFPALGIPLIEGRLFPPELKADSPPLVIINETMARRFWPHESAVGRRIGDRQGDVVVWREIIGVVRDIQDALNPSDPSTMYQVYKPLVNEPWGYLWLIVRAPAPATFKNEVRRAIADVDPDVAVQLMYTVPESADLFLRSFTVVNDTLGGFALLGLALAALGLYGVISNLVAQRTGEFGIRMALGAKPRDVLGLVLRRGIGLTFIGLLIGCGVAYALNLALRSSLPRMASSDPATIALVALFLFAVALFACWVPARRATRVDPVTALRAE
ncbi:MAG TPA: ABC transporter permease [Opitutaceae bacterium]|nr:ABC transporter permease [Opitutaceae bacterium]